MMQPPAADPAGLARSEMRLPERLDLRFEGFSAESFEVLDRLRSVPNVEQYRKEKSAIRDFLTEPFKRYRDDLVVNWVLPNRLDLETEKNVFSRLLKNDFGAGGCHHHLWMSFYRPDRRRLSDLQLIHSISPDGLTVGLYIGDHAPDLILEARSTLRTRGGWFRDAVEPLLHDEEWEVCYYTGSGGRQQHSLEGPAVPEADIGRMTGIWAGRIFPRQQVVDWKEQLVLHALLEALKVWPLYRLFA